MLRNRRNFASLKSIR